VTPTKLRLSLSWAPRPYLSRRCLGGTGAWVSSRVSRASRCNPASRRRSFTRAHLSPTATWAFGAPNMKLSKNAARRSSPWCAARVPCSFSRVGGDPNRFRDRLRWASDRPSATLARRPGRNPSPALTLHTFSTLHLTPRPAPSDPAPAAAAGEKLETAIKREATAAASTAFDVPQEFGGRMDYRTVSVLRVIGAEPGHSNNEIAERVGIEGKGHASTLLARLARFGLIENTRTGGRENEWRLTASGIELERAIRDDGKPTADRSLIGRASRTARHTTPRKPPQ
jgi:predicted transcriptional regulator